MRGPASRCLAPLWPVLRPAMGKLAETCNLWLKHWVIIKCCDLLKVGIASTLLALCRWCSIVLFQVYSLILEEEHILCFLCYISFDELGENIGYEIRRRGQQNLKKGGLRLATVSNLNSERTWAPSTRFITSSQKDHALHTSIRCWPYRHSKQRCFWK